MATSVRITAAYLDAIGVPSNAEVRVNQYAAEIPQKAGDVDLQVKGFDVEVLLTFVSVTATNLSGVTVFFIVSGTSYVNAVGNTPLVVSAEWVSTFGSGAKAYDWQFSNVTNEAGFVSTATTSAVTRTYTNAGGGRSTRGVSATISDGTSTASATYFVHLKAEQTPNPFDGQFQGENQARRRTYP